MTTKTKPSLLHPGPVLSGALLLVATGGAVALIQMIAKTASFAGIESPRLTALVGFAMLASPIVLVAGVHHTMQRILDRMAGEKTSHGAWPGLTSWWAGVFAWLTAALVSSVLLLAGGIIDAEHVVDSVSFIFVRSSWTELLSWPALLWVAGAAGLYVFERQAKHVFATSPQNTPTTAAPWKFYAASLARAVVLTTFLAELVVGAIIVGVVAVAAAERDSHAFAAIMAALVVVSPIVFVTLGDHGVRHVLRLFGMKHERLGLWPSVHSWWTGLYAWFVLAFGGVATFALHTFVFGAGARVDTRATLQPFGSTTITFVIVATALFHVEACVRRRLATRGE